MPISLVLGKPGTGKSQFALSYALNYVEKHNKTLITNFILNPLGLFEYCKIQHYWQTQLRINSKDSRIFYCDMNQSLETLLSIPDSIILCDETAIYFPSRGSTYNTPKSVLASLVQIRHLNQHVFFIAQSETQIDTQLRVLCDEIFVCDGTYNFDNTGKQKLISKSIKYFLPDQFDNWKNKPDIKKNPLKSRFAATKSFGGWLSISDIYLFSAYNSFNLIHSEKVSTQSTSFYPFYSLASNYFEIDGSSSCLPLIIVDSFIAISIKKTFDFLPAKFFKFRHLFIVFFYNFFSFSKFERKMFYIMLYLITFALCTSFLSLIF